LRRTVIALITGAAVVAGSGAVLGATSTLAGFTDSESNAASSVSAATVVLGGHGSPIALQFPYLLPNAPKTVDLTVENRGTVPVRAELALPSGPTQTSCAHGTQGWYAPLTEILEVNIGSHPNVTYCSLLNGRAVTLADAVPPGATVRVPITVTLVEVFHHSKHERAAITLRAVGGFTDHITGTIEISTGAITQRAQTRALMAAPAEPAVEPDPTVDAVPAECAAAGMTGELFTEVVALEPADTQFSAAAEDAPAEPGALTIIGTPGDDTIIGTEGPDCIVGGAGDDTLIGAGGDDVIVGSDGADRLEGAGGDDILLSGQGTDELLGGDGADVLDGGPDGASCHTEPVDDAAACLPLAPPAPAADITTHPSADATPSRSPGQVTPTEPGQTGPAPTEPTPSGPGAGADPATSAGPPAELRTEPSTATPVPTGSPTTNPTTIPTAAGTGAVAEGRPTAPAPTAPAPAPTTPAPVR
jgi:hypothetical protein